MICFSLLIFSIIIIAVLFFSVVNLPTLYQNSFGLSFNSTTKPQSNNSTLLKMYEIENELKLAIKNIPININYTIGHVQEASKLVDSDLEKEIMSLEPRVFNLIQSQIADLKIIVNNTKIPNLMKGAQISEGLSHIVDLVQLLQLDKIENDTRLSKTIPSFFSSLNEDILISYSDSHIWSNNQGIKQDNDTKNIDQPDTNNSSNYGKSLEYQTAQGLSAGVLEFIDNLIYLKPDAFKNYNLTKIKDNYSILNQLIDNKSHIGKIEKFSHQNLSNVQ